MPCRIATAFVVAVSVPAVVESIVAELVDGSKTGHQTW